MRKQHVKLTSEDRLTLTKLTDEGNISGRKYKRALSLLELDRGKTYAVVNQTVSFSSSTLASLAKKYKVEGLACLDDKPRSGRPSLISGEAKAKITALACSEPPEGYARWSLRLLAKKIVQLEYLDQISFAEVGRILKKTSCAQSATDNGASVR